MGREGGEVTHKASFCSGGSALPVDSETGSSPHIRISGLAVLLTRGRLKISSSQILLKEFYISHHTVVNKWYDIRAMMSYFVQCIFFSFSLLSPVLPRS